MKDIIDAIRWLLDKLEKELKIGDEVVKKRKVRVFKKPTIEEIQEYCTERKNNISSEYFYNHYESNWWKIWKNKMVDWKATIRRREISDKKKKEEKKVMTKEEFIRNKREIKDTKSSSLFSNIIHDRN